MIPDWIAEQVSSLDARTLAETLVWLALGGWLLSWLLSRPRTSRITVSVDPIPTPLPAKGDPVLNAPAEIGQPLLAKLDPKSKLGYATSKLASPPVWSSGNPAVLALGAPAPGGLACVFKPLATGTATINVTAGLLSASTSVDVVEGVAADLGLDVDFAPTDVANP